jgi:hypothetical protein
LDGHSVGGQNRFTLIFVDVHSEIENLVARK